jgi:hypothetical protein
MTSAGTRSLVPTGLACGRLVYTGGPQNMTVTPIVEVDAFTPHLDDPYRQVWRIGRGHTLRRDRSISV